MISYVVQGLEWLILCLVGHVSNCNWIAIPKNELIYIYIYIIWFSAAVVGLYRLQRKLHPIKIYFHCPQIKRKKSWNDFLCSARSGMIDSLFSRTCKQLQLNCYSQKWVDIYIIWFSAAVVGLYRLQRKLHPIKIYFHCPQIKRKKSWNDFLCSARSGMIDSLFSRTCKQLQLNCYSQKWVDIYIYIYNMV